MDPPPAEDLPVFGDASLAAIDWARLRVNNDDERKKLVAEVWDYCGIRYTRPCEQVVEDAKTM
jgi:hypothetical protein